MPFPEIKRVIYKKNPLEEVICSIHFPPILKIDAELPYDFQDKIRDFYPNFNERKNNIKIPQNIQIPKEVIQNINKNKVYEFISEDQIWKIQLTRINISLSCSNYIRWENFYTKLTDVLRAFSEVYKPSFYTRIGLRYIDIIRRSILDLRDVHWDNLIQPHILGLLGTDEIKGAIVNFNNLHEIMLADNKSTVIIKTNLVQHMPDKEICYLIDSDFVYNNKISIESAEEKLRYFNKQASNLIRWCFTEELHNALEPEDI